MNIGNRYYNKKRVFVFYIILLLEKLLDFGLDIYHTYVGELIPQDKEDDENNIGDWMRIILSFANTILMLYIAVSTFLKGAIQNKYIC